MINKAETPVYKTAWVSFRWQRRNLSDATKKFSLLQNWTEWRNLRNVYPTAVGIVFTLKNNRAFQPNLTLRRSKHKKYKYLWQINNTLNIRSYSV